MPRRYVDGADRGFAAGTSVPVEKSQAEVMKLLRREGASQMGFGTNADKVVVGFTAHGRQIKITIPVVDDGTRRAEQEARRKWRCMLLQLKAKFEAIRSEISTFEIEFQPHTVMPNGKTVSEIVGPLISSAYESGRMPALPEWKGN
jgi:hypothetical protein